MRKTFKCRCSSPATTIPQKKKFQVAVIGAGPSGCYVADFLTRKNPLVHVDVYERLPVPFGLSRYGVAPDHPEVKNVEKKFVEMFDSGRATLLGNMPIGKHLRTSSLLSAYSAIVIATGADSSRKVGIPGENLGCVYPARQIVSYYNTMPFPEGNPHISPVEFGEDTTRGVIIGNGNVALDCARFLTADYHYWCPTDMNSKAIRELMKNRMRRLTVAARRGPEHSAFTIAEFRELTKFQEHVKVSVQEFDLDKTLGKTDKSRAKKRLLDLVHKSCSPPPLEEIVHLKKKPPHPCDIRFEYHWKPVRFYPSKNNCYKVGGVEFEDSRTGVIENVPCDFVLTSVGYRSSPVIGVPFDEERGVIPNELGRVTRDDGTREERVYCSGWIKRGPKGVMLHTMTDAQETANSILEDIHSGTLMRNIEHNGKYSLLEMFAQKRYRPIGMVGYKRILKAEGEFGAELGKKSEKVPKIRQMVDLSSGGRVEYMASHSFRGMEMDRPKEFQEFGDFLDLSIEEPWYKHGEPVSSDNLSGDSRKYDSSYLFPKRD